MVIYTSYFAQLKKVKNPISIALWKPKWYNGPELLSLAPTKIYLQPGKILISLALIGKIILLLILMKS